MNKQREPIADSSHPIWADIDKIQKELGWDAWLKFLMSMDKVEQRPAHRPLTVDNVHTSKPDGNSKEAGLRHNSR